MYRHNAARLVRLFPEKADLYGRSYKELEQEAKELARTGKDDKRLTAIADELFDRDAAHFGW